MKEEVVKQWCKDLRSGEFKQGGEFLRDTENAYCCLGVLAKRFNENCEPDDRQSLGDTLLSNEVADLLEMRTTDGIIFPEALVTGQQGLALAHLNDGLWLMQEVIEGIQQISPTIAKIDLDTLPKNSGRLRLKLDFNQIADLIEERKDVL